ncbi:MAG TPA: mycothiol conjugate amidase Mca [Mycobacteriales bacterium]|nr:mycothiol conjugate amidase Mca [Mycobacteriales bacterium]
MPDVREPLRLLAVHAHPDDESSKGAATMARYVREGVDVLVATCTGGERGSILNPAMDRPDVIANLPTVREQEMARAVGILGVRHRWLGFVDSGLPEGDPKPPLPPGCFALEPLQVAAAPLVALIREFQPHVLLTYDENGGYPHPDHIRTHEISVEAYEAAGDPARYPEVPGEPWQVSKLYYFLTFHKERVMALDAAARARGLDSPYQDWLERWEDNEKDAARLTTSIECAEFFAVRDQALLAHATQVDPNGRWFGLPLELQRQAWPTEDYQLARQQVAVSLPEDDLFAGIREARAA